MSTDNTDNLNIFDEIDSLILSDTFITWFNATNEVIDAINPLRIYDIVGGAGVKEERSGGTVTISIDDGPGIKGVDNLTTGEKYFTLDFIELPELVTGTDDKTNPASDDLFCIETVIDTDGTSVLKKVEASYLLPDTIHGDHDFLGTISFSGDLSVDVGILTFIGNTDDVVGIAADVGQTEHANWFYNPTYDAWISNVFLGVDSTTGFLSNSGNAEALFKFSADLDTQTDVVIELRTGDMSDTDGGNIDSWYIAGRGNGGTLDNPVRLEFALQDYEELGSDDDGYNIVMSLERDDHTAHTYHVAKFHEQVYFSNIELNEQFSQIPTGAEGLVPLTSVDGFLSDTWLSRRTETNFDATGPNAITLGMAVTYDSTGKLVPAIANDKYLSNVVGIVETIVGGKAIFCARGDLDGAFSSTGIDLVPGQLYYLSPTTPGGVTPNIPTETFDCIRPLFVATSTTAVVVNIENWGREVDVTPRSVGGRVVIVTPNFKNDGINRLYPGQAVRFNVTGTQHENNTDDHETDWTHQTDAPWDTDSTAYVPDPEELSTDGDDPIRSWEELEIVNAQANGYLNSLTIGVCESIKTYEGVPHAVIVIRGEINGLSGLATGGVYYLDPEKDADGVAGQLTTFSPTDVGTVTKVVMYATSADRGWVDIEASHRINGYVGTNTISVSSLNADSDLSEGDVVRFDFTTDSTTNEESINVVKAMADTPENSEAIGVIQKIVDDGTFAVATFGEDDSYTDLVEGEKYYLSATVAGGITPTKPSGANTVVRQIGYGKSSNTLFVSIGEAHQDITGDNPTTEGFRTTDFDSTLDVGDWVRYYGGVPSWSKLVKADAFDYENSMTIGVITEKFVEGGKKYINVVTKGFVEDLYVEGPLSPGYIYYLAATPDSGSITETLPVQGKSVRKRCFIATTTTGGYVDIGESIVLDMTERTIIEEENYTTDVTVGTWVRYEQFLLDIGTDGTDRYGQPEDLGQDKWDGTDSTHCGLPGVDGKLFYTATGVDHGEGDSFFPHPDLDDIWDYITTDGVEETDEFNCACEAIRYVEDIAARAVANGSPGVDVATILGRLLYVPNADKNNYIFEDGWQDTGFLLSEYEANCECDTDGDCPDDSCVQSALTVTVETGVQDPNIVFEVGTDSTETTADYTDTVGPVFAIDGTDKKEINIGKNRSYTIYTNFTSTHSFKLSTTEDGIHNGGIEYTQGVRHVGTYGDPYSGYIDITTDIDTPDTLYYYCSEHPDMGGKINVTSICSTVKQYSRLTPTIVQLSKTSPNPTRSNAIGVVESFHNNKAVVVTQGQTMPLWNELTVGQLYYLSGDIDGTITRDRPESSFEIIKPVFIPTSNTSGVVNITSAYQVNLRDSDYYLFSDSEDVNVGSVVSHMDGKLVGSVGDSTLNQSSYNPLGMVVGRMEWGETYLYALRTNGLVTGLDMSAFPPGTPLFISVDQNYPGALRVSETQEVGKVSTRIGTIASPSSLIVNIDSPKIIVNEVEQTLTYDSTVAQFRRLVLTGSTLNMAARWGYAGGDEGPFAVLTTQAGEKVTIPDHTFSTIKGELIAMSHDGRVAWTRTIGIDELTAINGSRSLAVYHDSDEPVGIHDIGPEDTEWTGDTDKVEWADNRFNQKLWMSGKAFGDSSQTTTRHIPLGLFSQREGGPGGTDDPSEIEAHVFLTMKPNRNYAHELGIQETTDATDGTGLTDHDEDADYEGSTDFTGDAVLDIVVVGEDALNYNYVCNIEIMTVIRPSETEQTDFNTGWMGTEEEFIWWPCGGPLLGTDGTDDANADGCPDSECTSEVIGLCCVNGELLPDPVSCPVCTMLEGYFIGPDTTKENTCVDCSTTDGIPVVNQTDCFTDYFE